MSFASPDRLMWLMIAIPIIGFYILKTRLRRRRVATLLFWDQVFEEKRQRTLWQNLRHWLSLLLQLALVGLLGFALADPLWRSQSDAGQELILVIDNSASMQAVDPDSGRTRLQEAVDEAQQVAAGLRQGDRIALITSGTSVRVPMGMTDFAPTAEEALDKIEPTDGPTRVREAIEAARRLSTDPERRRIVVFSDGCISERDSIPAADDLRWVQVGQSTDNVAITKFQVRRSTIDPIGYALLVELSNFSDDPFEGRLRLDLDETLVDVIPFDLEPGATLRRTIEGTSREGGILVGQLDADDGLDVDNIARAVVPSRPSIPVRLIAGDETEAFYLRTVLDSIPLLEVDETYTGASSDESAESDGFVGLTVCSGLIPDPLPPGPLMIVAPDRDGPELENDGISVPAWRLGPELESPIIAKQDGDSPLLRHVQLQNVLLDGGRDIEVEETFAESASLLETADGANVLVAVERPAGRMLLLSADLNSSDLPLRIAFPVMMTNAVNWFFRQSGDMNPALATGQIATVPWDRPDAEQETVMMVDPAGIRRGVTVADRRASVGPTTQIGVYGLFTESSMPDDDAQTPDDDAQRPTPEELKQNSEARGELLAFNLCDANESDLRLPELGESTLGDPPAGGAPPWFYLALIAIGLVIGEWALFNRRVVA